jgi:hypothetical protein
MWLPPYFGSYEQLIKALLHNPFLGSGQGGFPPRAFEDPQSSPWRNAHVNPTQQAVALFISAATAKATASAMSDKEMARQIVASADAAISEVMDDYCGTPPRKVPWPFPGPPPWVWEISSELTTAANALQEGSLRSSLLDISGRVLSKGFGQTKVMGATAGR